MAENAIANDERDKILDFKLRVHERLLNSTEFAILQRMNEVQLSSRISQLTELVAHDAGEHLSTRVRRQVEYDVINEVLGMGPIQALLDDPEVTEVMVNGPYQVWAERAGKLQLTSHRFMDDAHVMRIIERIVTPLGRRIDESVPMVDARLPDGSRVNAVIPPLALDGPCVTIRKFPYHRLSPQDLVRFGTMSEQMMEFLQACVVGRLNTIVSGGTDTGKTTALNVLSSFIPDGERIVTIEDAAELRLQQRHVIRLESRPANIEGRGMITMRELVRNALRMRPDRIVVGEVRGPEALDMLQAMNTGHEGSLSTLHSNGPRDTLSRIETMILMAGMDLPLSAIREQISRALHLIVHLARLRDGTRRIVSIAEVQRQESGNIVLQDLFTFERTGIGLDGRVQGRHRAIGVRPLFVELLEAEGMELPSKLFSA